MKKTLFFTYNRLYPGKADIIISAINQASDEGEKMNLTGKELQDYIEEKILDRVDP